VRAESAARASTPCPLTPPPARRPPPAAAALPPLAAAWVLVCTVLVLGMMCVRVCARARGSGASGRRAGE
jgi:hypothetical protein